jgi:hypothetical protein
MHSQSDQHDYGCVRTARWDARTVGSEDSPTSSTANLSLTDRTSFDREGGSPKGMSSSDAKIHRWISLAEKLNSAYTGEAATDRQTKESNPERLQFIIDNPTLCNLFRDHYGTTFARRTVLAGSSRLQTQVQYYFERQQRSFQRPPPERLPGGKGHTPGQQAVEQHHETLIQQAYLIYTTYLAPSSPSELNIDHGLRNELSAYLSDVICWV